MKRALVTRTHGCEITKGQNLQINVEIVSTDVENGVIEYRLPGWKDTLKFTKTEIAKHLLNVNDSFVMEVGDKFWDEGEIRTIIDVNPKFCTYMVNGFKLNCDHEYAVARYVQDIP